MSGLCPNCGYDLVHDEPITLGRASFDPRGDFIWDGRSVPLDPCKRIIVGTLMKARGSCVALSTIADRMGYGGELPENSVRVHVSRIRTMLADAPIQTVRGVGYRWAA